MTYLKITNVKENHRGLQYHDGLVVDIVPFDPENQCGIYFTTPEYIFDFLSYGINVREVTIPEVAKMIESSHGTYKASSVVLGPKKSLSELSTWIWLESLGTDLCTNWKDVVSFSLENGCLQNGCIQKEYFEIIRYLISKPEITKSNIHIEILDFLKSLYPYDPITYKSSFIEIDYEMIRASSNGHLELVKFFVSIGADIFVFDNRAVRYASRNGHLDVVKYLVSIGADIHDCDDCSLRYALTYGHQKVVDYIKSLG